MQPIPWRVQLGVILAAYAVTLGFSGILIYQRYLLYKNHADEATAASGMYAFGDLMLGVMIFCMLMVPTFFLVRLMAKFEGVFRAYSRFLLGLSLSAPVSIALVFLFRWMNASALSDICLWRPMFAPFVMVGLAMSRLVAKFKSAKRLLNFALLFEGASLLTMVLLIVFVH